MVSSFAATNIGFSHIASGRPCQDYSLCKDTEEYSVAVVCDGHGGERYFRSEVGSRMAAEAAMEMLEDFLSNTKFLAEMPADKHWQTQLAGSIVVRWNEKISDYTNETPFTDEECSNLSDNDKRRISSSEWQFAYGTTLICVVVTKSAFMGFQIGDGKCVAFDVEGNCSEPIPWDDDCFLNSTTSLCDTNAVNRFRFSYLRRDNISFPNAVFIGSDGVDDSYPGESLYEFYKVLLREMHNDKDATLDNLKSYLPQISEKGSKDDISIAGIINDGKI